MKYHIQSPLPTLIIFIQSLMCDSAALICLLSVTLLLVPPKLTCKQSNDGSFKTALWTHSSVYVALSAAAFWHTAIGCWVICHISHYG